MIKIQLERLFLFFIRSRHSESTSLIKKIAEENDVWVVASNQEQVEKFGDKGVTITDEMSDRLLGLESKPILIDNYTMINLLEDSLNRIDSLESQLVKTSKLNQEYEKYFNDISNIIKSVKYELI